MPKSLDVLDRFHAFLTAADSSNHVAIIDDRRAYTYADVREIILAYIVFLEDKGVRKGDTVVVQLENSYEFSCCYLAVILHGCVVIPVSTTLPEDGVRYIKNITKPALVIDALEDLPDAHLSTGTTSFAAIDCDQTCAIFFTSGTTGRPKGVSHSINSLLCNADAFNQMQGVGREIRMLHVMPMSYMAGFLNTLLCPLVAGGTVIIAPQFNSFTAVNFWNAAMLHGANAVWMSPSMVSLLTRLCRSDEIVDWVQQHMRHIFVGTAALLPAVKQAFEDKFHAPCLESYGSTEMLLVAGNTLTEKAEPQTVGKIVNGTHVDINPDDDEIRICSDYAYQGYLDEDGVLVPFVSGGLFATGDCGYVSENQFLFISGRKKDLIIRGGLNISPKAVENVLTQVPGIKDAAVIGRAHPVWGEEVVAFLELHPETEFDAAACKAYCSQNLQLDAVPSDYFILDSFPRSSVGKIQKSALREML